MLSGPALIAAFVLAIIVLILMISRWKVHPFLALLAISFLFGLAAGIPLQTVKEGDKVVKSGLVETMTTSFAGTFKGIGLVILFGSLIGAILEKTGAALKIADCVVRFLGPKHPELAMLIMGWLVSIPVFCDSGYIILNPIRKALVKRTRHSAAALAVCLSAGLYASHVFIPPTPGPIAAADALGAGHLLLLVMGLGTLVSVPALGAAYLYAMTVRNMRTAEELEEGAEAASSEEVLRESFSEALLRTDGELPSAFLSFLPILLPILLMALGSVVSAVKWQGEAAKVFTFLGTPVVAIALGMIAGFFLLPHMKKGESFRSLTDDTLRAAGPILFITAAGGILGKVIAESSMISYIEQNANALLGLGILFPFLLSAILKTAQGSSTVALVTTSGIMAPMMATMHLESPLLRVLTILAIGAGAMTVSHANDSYFWVVTNFSGMKTEQGYRTQTVVTLIEGLASMVLITALWWFLK